MTKLEARIADAIDMHLAFNKRLRVLTIRKALKSIDTKLARGVKAKKA